MPLSASAANDVKDLIALMGQHVTRYRVSVLRTADVRVAAAVAAFVGTDCGGETIDALSPSLIDEDAAGVRPMQLVSWLGRCLTGDGPRCLLHVDAILATWTSASDVRVWWEQLALLERDAPLLVATARTDLQAIDKWGCIDRPIWVDEAEVDVWAPRASNHYQQLKGVPTP
jgi:hypothetical protein